MKTKSLRRAAVLSLGLFGVLSTTSCMTTYDAYGRPVQSVDPGMAAAGVAAAGLLGYALADGHGHHHGGYYGGGYYGGYRGHCY